MQWVGEVFLGVFLFQGALVLGATNQEPRDLIDYSTLTHEINIRQLRGGNHDDSGFNDYFFRVFVYGLPIVKEEVGKEFKDRKKIMVSIGEFGSIAVKSLNFFQFEKPAKLRITGEVLRELTAHTMRKFKILEERVAIFVEIEMFERNKKFVFFGEDRVIGKTSYYVIPETLPHTPSRKNKDLVIKDDHGTSVEMLVNYQVKISKPKVIE